MTRRTLGAALLAAMIRCVRADNSLLGNGSGLDHVGIVEPDLLDLERSFRERLGFSLYTGSRYPTGVYSALIPFQDTPAYVELLSFYQPADRSDPATAYLADRSRLGGPALFAMNCAPIETTARTLRDRGFPLIGPKGRTVLRDGKEEPAPYRIIRIDKAFIGPKESVAFIEYRNNSARLGPERVARARERLQLPSGEFHPNTARRLAALWIAVRSLSNATEVMQRMGFTPGAERNAAVLAARGRAFPCGDGTIVLWEPQGRGALETTLKERGEGPFGIGVEVLEIETARRAIERGGTELKREWLTKESFILPQAISGGSWIEFAGRR